VVRLSEENGSLRWSGEAIDAVWGLTAGHPYLLQHLCWQVWQRAHEGGQAEHEVSAEDVETAVPATLGASSNALEWLWGGLPPAAKVVAAALARAGAGVISEGMLEQTLKESGVKVLIRELQEAPERLRRWDIIEPVEGGHRFQVELLRRWIARNKTPALVQQELDYIEPLAEALYKTGEGYYRAGDPDSALDQLLRATRTNPSHRRANELVADIYISRSAWAEAQRVLERLGENYPAQARPRLVQVLLERARQARTEVGALALYDQVLALDESNVTAIEGGRAIWKARGDRALDAKSYGEAQAAYAAAGRTDLVEEVSLLASQGMLASVEEQVRELERAEQYGKALDEIRRAHQTLRGLKDWAPDIARIEGAQTIAANYQRASVAFKAGDMDTARRLFVDVVAMNEQYKDAAKLLYEAVSGVNVDNLIEDATRAKEREKRAVRRLTAVGLLTVIMSGVVVSRMARQSSQPAVSPALTSTSAGVATATPPLSTSSSELGVVPPGPPCPSGMTFIPGGSFQIGSDDIPGEELHAVDVESFCIDTTEVTVRDYSECVTRNNCTAAGDRYAQCNSTKEDRQDHPVNCVDWNQANAHCKAQNKRLPSEEEWEYAARAGRGYKYPWGDGPPTSLLCWNGEGNDRGKENRTTTCPVGKYPSGDARREEARLHDMAGNVWEWTSSHHCPYRGHNCENKDYVFRGGSWQSSDAGEVRTTTRHSGSPNGFADDLGFRCAWTPKRNTK
jgi:formylglycine-generating enzyme required for sulfatase activity/tetratricopeptide (TPR) repeat protein